MGILNVTPDSFSDGGRYLAVNDAIDHGLSLARDGADVVDVGGESTRPGAERVSEQEELDRVLPVVEGLVDAGVVVSIDTTRSCVAEAALAAGARVVNDVSGGLADPAMPGLIARRGVPYIVMHWRGPSIDMARRAVYYDVVTEVRDELSARVTDLLAEGVSRDQLILDPGIGFAKEPAHSWRLLGCLDVLGDLGRPLMVGASRKRLLRSLQSEPDVPLTTAESDVSTAVISAAVAGHASWVRVHNVRANLLAVRTAVELRRSSGADPTRS